jgi:hypothetical protein
VSSLIASETRAQILGARAPEACEQRVSMKASEPAPNSAADPATVWPTHPKGTQARVLLTSVFGPYARDDEFGSRAINPMELYQNQVTRAQGAFSLRMFHRSWGLMMIQENISAPSTLLDFPTRAAFAREFQAALRCGWHLVHYRERPQGTGDVPDGARAFAALHQDPPARTGCGCSHERNHFQED